MVSQDTNLNTDMNQDDELGDSGWGPSRLFQGVDAFTEKAKGNAAVQGKETTGNNSDTKAEYKLTTSISEFEQSIDISAELAVANLLGTSSLSAKVQFASELKLTEKSVVVLVNFYKSTRYSAKNIKLSGGVIPLPSPANKKDLINFFDNYGNKFVSQISKGGQYIAAYVFQSTSREEQNKIAAELNASGITSGAKVDAKTTATIETIRKQTNVFNEFSQILIGYPGITLPTQQGEIPTFLTETLPQAPHGDAILGYSCDDYYEVPGLTRDMFSPITASYDLFKNECEPISQKLVALKSAANRVKEVYDTYGYTLDSKLTDAIKKANTAETDLRKVAEAIAKNPTNDLPTLPDTSIVKIGLPSINFSGPESKTAIAGTSTGGNIIANFSRNQILGGVVFAGAQVKETNGCIIELQSYYGVWKDSVITDEHQIVQAKGDPNITWTPDTVDFIPPGYFVTKLKGYASPPDGDPYWSNNAAAVEMWLTGDDTSQSTSRVVGKVSPNSVEGGTWEPKIDTEKETYEVFVGWSGNCGLLINQLGPQVMTFSPAKWHPLN